MKKPSVFLIGLGLAVIYLVWGSTYLAIRVAVSTLPPFSMAGARFIVAGSIVFVFLIATGKFKASKEQWLYNLWIGMFMLLGGNGLVSWAEKDVPSGIATLIVSFNPLMMVIAEWGIYCWSNKEKGARPSWLVFMGLAVGLAGLLYLLWPTFQLADATAHDSKAEFQTISVLAIVLACATWTIGSMMTRYARKPVDPFSGAAIQMLCGGSTLLIFGISIGELSHFDFESISRESVSAWAYLVVAGSLLAFTTFVWLMKHTSPTIVSTYAYINPVVAVFLGWWLLNERVDQTTLVAAAIIITGVALMTLGRGMRKPTSSTGMKKD